MTDEQKQFLRDVAESLENKTPMTYADQTRLAFLIRKCFPEVFSK